MNDGQRPRLNLVLELLRDCHRQCRACYVPNAEMNFTEFNRALDLVRGCERAGFSVYTVRLGATDIFAAQNAIEVLQDPRFGELVQNPDTRLLFNTTLTNPDEQVRNVVRALNTHYRKDHLYFNVVLHPSVVRNESKIRKIQDSMELIRSLSSGWTPHFAAGVNVEMNEEFFDSLPEVFHFAEKLMPEVEMELGLGFARQTGRNPELVAQTFERMNRLNLLRQLFLHEKTERENGLLHVLWQAGRWYWMPNLYYEYVSASEPSMRIEFTDFDDLLEKFNSLYVSQYFMPELECGECQFFRVCSFRLIPAYMRVLGRTQCIAPKQRMLENLI